MKMELLKEKIKRLKSNEIEFYKKQLASFEWVKAHQGNSTEFIGNVIAQNKVCELEEKIFLLENE